MDLFKRKGGGTKAAPRRPKFTSDNRKVDWDNPVFIEGMEYYPIEGARTKEGRRHSSTEYAAPNGSIVIVSTAPNGTRSVRKHLGVTEQLSLSRVHGKDADGMVIDYPDDHNGRSSYGFRDVCRAHFNPIWVVEATYIADDGGFRPEPSSINRYTTDYPDLEKYLRDKRKDKGVVHRNVTYDGRTVTRYEMPAAGPMYVWVLEYRKVTDKESATWMSHHVPGPPGMIKAPASKPKVSANTKSSRDAVGRELDRLAKNDSRYAGAAKDPEVRKWVRDYYEYVEEAYHGNQGSPAEVVGDGFIIRFIAGTEDDDIDERIRDVLDVDYGGEGAEIYSRLDSLRPKVRAMLGSANRKPKVKPKTKSKTTKKTGGKRR